MLIVTPVSYPGDTMGQYGSRFGGKSVGRRSVGYPVSQLLQWAASNRQPHKLFKESTRLQTKIENKYALLGY